MTRFARSLFSALALCALASPAVGCASRTDTAPLVRVPTQPSAVSDCAPAARAVAPAYALAVADPTGVQSTVGPSERARAAVAMPGGWVKCGATWLYKVGVATGEGLQCLGESFVNPFDPPASVRYTYGSQPAVTSPGCCGSRCAPPSGPTPLPLPLPQGPGGGLEPNIPDPGAVRR